MLGLFTTNRKRMVKTILGNFSEDHFLCWLFFICELIFLNFFARFTLVPLKPLIKLSLFLSWILIIFHWHLSSKVTCRFIQQNQRSITSKLRQTFPLNPSILCCFYPWNGPRARVFLNSLFDIQKKFLLLNLQDIKNVFILQGIS